MAKKKHGNVQVSQADSEQAQQLASRYHAIAKTLRSSKNQQQAETAIEDINHLPEASQLALLKQLAKENSTDAADVLSAVNQLGSDKNARKEARRGLIQLEGYRIYPVWEAPADRSSAIQTVESAMQRASETSSVAPRFWKGLYSDTRESGEIQLLLIWEQGNGYRDVRVMGFLLEFWRDGVKDFFTRVESKRSFENFLAEMQSSGRIALSNCSLAKGRSLLLEALAVNEQFHTRPYKDYRLNASLINQFILNNPDIENATDLDEDELDFNEDDEDEDEYDEIDESILTEDLPPPNIVATFVELWLGGKFELAYDLLTEDSSIREGLPQEEWVERRQAWHDQMHPDRFMPYYAQEIEPQKSGIWLPNPFKGNRQGNTKQCEASWSVELTSSPLQASLPELPEATCICQETGRQWFCATFTLAREQDRWRIRYMTDRGRELLMMPVAEFDKQFTEHEQRIKDITSKHKPSDQDSVNYLPEVLTLTLRSLSFVDTLYKRRPLVEQEELEEGPHVTEVLGEYERAFAYLDQLQQIFPENRARYLQMQAAEMMELGESLFENDEERAQHFFAIAIEKMRESLSLSDEAENRLSLSQMIVRSNGDLDEAAALVRSASTEITDPQRQSVVENELGNIAFIRQNYSEALTHFQRSLELDPVPAIQDLNMAHAHTRLGNSDEAITYYKQALQKEPDIEDAYLALSRLYIEQGQPEEAIRTMEDGVRNNPDSLEMRLEFATICMDTGNYDQAEQVVQEIGRDVPEAASMVQEMIQMVRQRKKSAGRIGLPSSSSSRTVKFSSKKKKK